MLRGSVVSHCWLRFWYESCSYQLSDYEKLIIHVLRGSVVFRYWLRFWYESFSYQLSDAEKLIIPDFKGVCCVSLLTAVLIRKLQLSVIRCWNANYSCFKGVCCVSLLTAVLIRKLQLSDAEKNVLMFVNKNRKSMKKKRAAARMIQTAWRAYKVQHLSNFSSPETAQREKLHNRDLLEK